MTADQSWWFDFATEGEGGYASLTYRRDEQVAEWSAAFVGGGWPLVAVRAHDVRIPARGTEIRTDGLWASVTSRTVMMEAFGAVFEDPLEGWGQERGDVVPFGYDLEWDDGEVHGEVLIGDGRIDIDATGSTVPLPAGDTVWGDDGLPTEVDGLAVVHVSPVKPFQLHALCAGRRWVSWADVRTSPTRRPPG